MAFHSDKLRLLDNPLFHDARLDDGDRASLDRSDIALRQYPAHKHIVLDGERENRTFIVHAGWGCLYKDLPEGERQIIDFTLTGDLIGLQPSCRKAEAAFVALTDLTVFEMRSTSIVALLRGHEQLADVFIAAAVRRYAITVQHLIDTGRRSALARTAHLLLELGARLAKARLADDSGFDCPLTQYDLADALGLTAIHVNRMLRELREFGFLSFRKGRVEYLDRPGLMEFAEFDDSYLA